LPKYNHITNIPAKVFFQTLKDKNYQNLKPKPSEQGLEAVFMSIHDDFFLQSDNEEAKEYLRVIKDVSKYEYQIAVLKQALHFYFYNKTTEQMRLEFIEALKKGYNIRIDKDKPFTEEVHRVLTTDLGIIQNDLSIAKIELEQMTKKSQAKDFDYYEQIGVLSTVLPNNALLKENMTLAVYVALEKQAKKVTEQQNKKK
jgi:hypothetical protein